MTIKELEEQRDKLSTEITLSTLSLNTAIEDIKSKLNLKATAALTLLSAAGYVVPIITLKKHGTYYFERFEVVGQKLILHYSVSSWGEMVAKEEHYPLWLIDEPSEQNISRFIRETTEAKARKDLEASYAYRRDSYRMAYYQLVECHKHFPNEFPDVSSLPNPNDISNNLQKE